MILIFSNKNDLSTHRVLDWLSCTDIPYILIYPETSFQLISLEIGDFIFKVDNKTYSYSQLSGMWKRRGYIPDFWDVSHIKEADIPILVQRKIIEHIQVQKKAIKDYLIFLFDKLPCINKTSTSHVNKLSVLLSLKLKISMILGMLFFKINHRN